MVTIDQRAALEAIPDHDLEVDRADLMTTLEQPPTTGTMTTVRLAGYLLATIVVTVLAAIVWSAAH